MFTNTDNQVEFKIMGFIQSTSPAPRFPASVSLLLSTPFTARARRCATLSYAAFPDLRGLQWGRRRLSSPSVQERLPQVPPSHSCLADTSAAPQANILT